MHHRRARARTLWIASLAAIGVARWADAQAFTWNTTNGTFSVAGNWTPAGGPPNAATDGAVFNSANTYTVTFTNSPSIGSLSFLNSTATFASSGSARTLTLANASNISSGNLTISSLTLSEANGLTMRGLSTTTVRDSGLLQAAVLTLGTVEDASLVIDGSGAAVNLTAGGAANLGLTGANGTLVLRNGAVGTFTGVLALAPSSNANSGGTVLVQSGSGVTASSLRVAINGVSGQTGSFQVTGAGSSFVQTGASTISVGTTSGSAGTIQVDTNGQFTSGTGSINIGATGTILVSAASTFNANGDIFVNGGHLEQQSTGVLALAAGKSISVIGSSAVATFASSRSFSSSQTLSVTGGGSFAVGNFVDFGNGGAGTLLVDGAGSRFVASVLSFIGSGATGAATVTISTGGIASFSAVDVGRLGGVGTVTISGGTLSLNAASTINTGGTLKLQSGTFAPLGNVTVAGTFNQSGGAFSLAANRLLTVSGVASLTSDLSLSNGQSIGVSGTGSLNSSGDIDVGTGSVSGSIALSGASPQVTQSGAATLAIGGSSTGIGTLSIPVGTYQMGTGAATVGATGHLIITGGAFKSSGVLNAAAGADITLNTGTLDLLNFTGTGAGTALTFTDGTLRLGAGNPSLPLNLFDGPNAAVAEMNGTTFNSAGSVVVGQSQVGVLRLQNAASFQYASVTVGQSAGSKGTLDINSSASLRTTSLDIGYGTTGTDGGAGTTIVQTSGSLQTLGAFRVGSHGTMNILTGGGLLGSSDVTDLIRGGRVTVDATSRLVVASDSANISSNPLGLSIYGISSGAPNPTPAVATLTIDTGGLLTSSSAVLANKPRLGAVITATGTSSLWHNLGSATIGVGDATLEALSGGQITVDGTLNFNQGPQLTIAGGTASFAGLHQFGSPSAPLELNLVQGGLSISSPVSVGPSGLIDRVLSVPGSSSVSINGTLTIQSGGVLDLAGGTLTAFAISGFGGDLNLASGTLIMNLSSLSTVGFSVVGVGTQLTIGNQAFVKTHGSVMVLSSGAIFGEGGTLISDGSLTNNGSIGFFGGLMSFPLAPTAQNNAGAEIDAINARLTFNGNGTSDNVGLVNLGTLGLMNAIVDGDVRSPAGSTINVGAGVTFNGLVSGAASFPGAGIVTFNGGYSPGDSPAAITFNGPVTFGPANHLMIELGGKTAGTQYDKVAVTGLASLAGVVDVSLINGFTALPGDQFEILDFGSRSGDVTVVNTSSLAGLSFNKVYTSNSLTLVASGLGGDANLDAKVDINDLLALALHFNTSGNWLNGDFNGSGVIDKADLGILASHWQAGVGSPALPALLESLGLPQVPADVPEPAVAALFGVAGVVMVRRRRS